MTILQSDLERRFQNLADDLLLTRYVSGDLTEMAQEVARRELISRGIAIPESLVTTTINEEPVSAENSGKLVRVAGFLNYAEAEVLRSFLESEGIPVVLADAHLAAANQFLSAATGGVRVLVHQANLVHANEMAAGIRRGDYEIDEDFDVGDASI